MRDRSTPSSVTTAVILAGGLGTRLRATVPDLPKPMAPVNGRPFLEHQMDYWIGQGIREFVLSVGYRREVVIEHFGDAYRGASVRYAVETEPLGTGGGLLLAAADLSPGRPFLVLNGDTFFEVLLADLAAFHDRRRSEWTFSLFRSDEAGRYMGMEVAQDGRIMSLRSGTGGRPGMLANGGVYLVEPSVLPLCGFPAGAKVSLEDDILAALHAKDAELFGFECPGRFIDIGIPDDYFRAADMLAAA